MEDSELVRRALQRDQQAFAALYDRYADRLFDYARRQTGSTADAGDIVQDTFVLAIQRLHQLRDPSLVRPWLYAIARSEVHRRHRRLNRLQFTEPDEQAAMSADGPSADDLVHQQELRALFTEAANGLDPADREVLDLHLRHNLTGVEIAAALGIPERQVSVTVQRVRERLARSIGVVLLARSPACGELGELQRTDGTPLTVLSRKRLARHIDGCATCGQQLHDRMRPETLLAALPIALAPAAWRAEVLQRMAMAGGPAGDGGDPRRPLRRRENTRVWQHSDGFPRPAVSRGLLTVIAGAATAGVLLVAVLVMSGGDAAKRVTAGATTTVSVAAKPSSTGTTVATDATAVAMTDRTPTTSQATTSTSTPPTSATTPTTVAGTPTAPPTAPATVPPTAPPDT
ncbi:MAG: sigma-70 family RNA polymerase sigma factor, partial [Ilumatobacteraceae bacterium]